MRASTPSRSSWRTGSVAAGSAVPVGAGQPVLRAQHLSKSYHSPSCETSTWMWSRGSSSPSWGPPAPGSQRSCTV